MAIAFSELEINMDDRDTDSPPESDTDNGRPRYSMSELADLPRDLNVANFAKNRATELASLTACVEVISGNKRLFQQLPRHMRRRAQSYNDKRVPRRIQDAHRRELEKVSSSSKKSSKKKKKKMPSRRHRRNFPNLMLEYNRRQKEFVWLETHIWHAKRFKMSQQWGYKIPLHPCDKSVRACYRGATRAALLHDISYYCCIEIAGGRQKILEVLRQMTSTECGLTFESVSNANGEYEGSVILYHRNSYPHGCIGDARFMWRPSLDSGTETTRQLWIWVHPACHDELLQELIEGFKLSRNVDPDPIAQGGAVVGAGSPSKLLGDKAFLKLEPKLRPFYERTPIYIDKDKAVRVKVLKDNLVRLRLIGQLSTAILTEVLQVDIPKDVDKQGDEKGSESVEMEVKIDEPLAKDEIRSCRLWWQNPDRLSSKACSAQHAFWKDMAEAPFSSRLPARSIVGLTVRDPRQFLLSEKSKVPPTIPDECSRCDFPLMTRLPPDLSDSPLWDKRTRDDVTFSKMSDQEINKMRSQNLVPGSRLDLGIHGCRIPLILVQNPGNQTKTSTSEINMGWDLILPAGWAMPFWIPIVYRNARVGGLRELASVARQSQTFHFPEDFPDTAAGQTSEADHCAQLTNKYFRYPPNKRPNYAKLGIVAPFHSPWDVLTNEWANLMFAAASTATTNSEGKFYVMRDRSVLRSLQRAMPIEMLAKKRKDVHSENASVTMLTEINSRSIVAIRLKILAKGTVSDFALICIPNDEDLQQQQQQPIDVYSRSAKGPREPCHPDETKALRKSLDKECRNGSKFVRKWKKQSAVDGSEKNAAKTLDTEMRLKLNEAIEIKWLHDKAKLRQLFIPTTQVDKVAQTCSRSIIGFAKSGYFSYVDGCFMGVAFVSLSGLVNAIVAGSPSSATRTPRNVLLVRQTNSDQYRYATYSVLI